MLFRSRALAQKRGKSIEIFNSGAAGYVVTRPTLELVEKHWGTPPCNAKKSEKSPPGPEYFLSSVRTQPCGSPSGASALDLALAFFFASASAFLFGEFAHALVLQPSRRHDRLGARVTDTVHVRQRRLGSLVVRDFNPGDARRAHAQVTASLRGRLSMA